MGTTSRTPPSAALRHIFYATRRLWAPPIVRRPPAIRRFTADVDRIDHSKTHATNTSHRYGRHRLDVARLDRAGSSIRAAVSDDAPPTPMSETNAPTRRHERRPANAANEAPATSPGSSSTRRAAPSRRRRLMTAHARHRGVAGLRLSSERGASILHISGAVRPGWGPARSSPRPSSPAAAQAGRRAASGRRPLALDGPSRGRREVSRTSSTECLTAGERLHLGRVRGRP